MNNPITVPRRAVLQGGALLLTAAMNSPLLSAETDEVLRIGMITDLHYADKPAAGSRYYRQTLKKIDEAAAQFEKDKPAFLVELGDLIDSADEVETELKYLKTINKKINAICDDRHYVLGNHCVDMLTKAEFLGEVEQENSFYSFERGTFHFVVLDACYRSDGKPYGRKNSKWTDANIPAPQLEWLKDDLESTSKAAVVFAHQRLDVSRNYSVKNHAAVRKVLQDAGNVLAVFQGHSHHNELVQISGIPYCTLAAMVEGEGAENNGYSLLEIELNGDMRLHGFRRQEDYML